MQNDKWGLRRAEGVRQALMSMTQLTVMSPALSPWPPSLPLCRRPPAPLSRPPPWPQVTISATKEGIKFSTSGDVGTANITIRWGRGEIRGRRAPQRGAGRGGALQQRLQQQCCGTGHVLPGALRAVPAVDVVGCFTTAAYPPPGARCSWLATGVGEILDTDHGHTPSCLLPTWRPPLRLLFHTHSPQTPAPSALTAFHTHPCFTLP